MKSIFALTSLLSLFLSTSAADPRLCAKGNDPLTASAFTLQQTNDNSHLASLSHIFSSAGKNVSIPHVLDSANRDLVKGKPPVGTSPVEAWKWNSGDMATTKWVPQGISSSADASASGKWDGREMWLVSWHRDDDKSVRVSFVDRKTHKYRHVLLVEPTADDNFAAVPVHAGGIAWYGEWLYVVDTSHGVRVFDLSKIWQVEDGDDVGKKGGKYSAAGYLYVLPQIRSYKWTPGSSSPFRFSWISVDRSDNTLLVGEFIRDSSKDPIRLVKYPLDTDTGKLKTNDKSIVTATFAHCADFLRMQGGFSYDNTFYLSRSNGRSPKAGDMFKWKPGKAAELRSGWFMAGNEDLSYNKVRKEYYTVSEYDGERFILAYNKM
ncbi:uncharacterized protein P174DRAFT_422391 [Aspergillus novofumigatus IBT 16806]|uniref:Secreted protein n=1 Tax=Aspergillus novofumigatus (strain IBT 16806) TaxID=1392255 RepID=A0A2I1C6Y0_ASPN1|nr:uncharacterized protein P174DRAFT_422391 [Aspergillus novofumigatus IBT 16806]PKX93389.1 hypothetical protein P174DRAFT_422391 [Aspergillus novofumigatus IBT 16806]